MTNSDPIATFLDKAAKALTDAATKNEEQANTQKGFAGILTDQNVRNDLNVLIAHGSLFVFGLIERVKAVVPDKDKGEDGGASPFSRFL